MATRIECETSLARAEPCAKVEHKVDPLTPVPQNSYRGMLMDTLTVSALGAVVKIAGAVKLVVMARAFGIGDELDAFLIAFLAPSLVAETLAGPLTASLVPGFIEARENQSPRRAELVYQQVLALILLLLLVAAGVLGVCGPVALPYLASGFPAEKLRLTQGLLPWLLPILPLSGLSVGWRARLNADGQFAVAAAAPCMVPLTSILAVLTLSPAWGIYALLLGTVAGAVLEVTLLGSALHLRGCAVLPRLGDRSPAVKRILGQYLPLMIAALVFSLATLVDQMLAARLESGSVAALNFGSKLMTVILSIAVAGITAAVIPHLSRLVAVGDWDTLVRTLRSYGCWIVALTIPATVILILCSGLLVRVLFQSGAFTASAAALVATVQQAAFLRIPFAILLALLFGVLSSLRANQILLWAAIGGLAVNSGLDLLLMNRIGVTGISLAGSFTSAVLTLYLAAVARKVIQSRRFTC